MIEISQNKNNIPQPIANNDVLQIITCISDDKTNEMMSLLFENGTASWTFNQLRAFDNTCAFHDHRVDFYRVGFRIVQLCGLTEGNAGQQRRDGEPAPHPLPPIILSLR